MTVKEAIDELKRCNEDANIKIRLLIGLGNCSEFTDIDFEGEFFVEDSETVIFIEG